MKGVSSSLLLLLLVLLLVSSFTSDAIPTPIPTPFNDDTHIQDPSTFPSSHPTIISSSYDIDAIEFFTHNSDESQYIVTVFPQTSTASSPSLTSRISNLLSSSSSSSSSSSNQQQQQQQQQQDNQPPLGHILFIRSAQGHVYRMGKYLGHGTFGIVNEAYHLLPFTTPSTTNTTSISLQKVIIKRPIKTQGLQELLNEIEFLESHLPDRFHGISSHHCPQSNTFRFYAIFTFIPGTTLLDFILDSQKPPHTNNYSSLSSQLSSLFSQISKSANTRLWDNGIAHNDLRPPNIIITPFNNSHSINFIDFALSTTHPHRNRLSQNTRIVEISLLFGDLVLLAHDLHNLLQNPNSSLHYRVLYEVVLWDLGNWLNIFITDIMDDNDSSNNTLRDEIRFKIKSIVRYRVANWVETGYADKSLRQFLRLLYPRSRNRE